VRRVFSIAALNLQQLLRNRGELVGVIVLPLLLTWVFGLAFGSGSAGARMTKIPLADADNSRYSKFIADTVNESDSFRTVVVTEAEARRQVRDGDAAVAIIVARGFGDNVEHGRDARVLTLRDPGSADAQAIVQVVSGATDRLATDAKAAHVAANALVSGADGVYPSGAPDFRTLFRAADRFWRPNPPVGVTTKVVIASAAHSSELSAPANTQYSLGFTVFFVLMVSLGGAGGFLEDRELGTLRRLLATPASRGEIVLGKVSGVALIGAFEATILVGFGALVFGVPWGSAPLAVVIVLGSLVLAATGMGVMLSVLVRTRSQLSSLTPVISTALAMLGGCYWPLEITSPFMQKVALATPTGWAMIGLKNTVARGLGVEAVLVPALVLLSMAAVFFAIGLSRLRLE
jgi:ABC-2 type transport system permease protein